MRKTHEQIKKEALSRSSVKQAYDTLDEEFALLKELIEARLNSGKTQEAVAKSMGTTTSVIGRLEAGGGAKKHSPSVATLRKYARAVGCSLQLKLIPQKINHHHS